MHEYTDAEGNTWKVDVVGPRNPASTEPNQYRVWVAGKPEQGASHGSPNLAESIAECVRKATWLKEGASE